MPQLTDDEIRAHPAYRSAVRAAIWFVASAAIGIPTVLIGGYLVVWREDDSVIFVCLPLLVLSQSLQLVRFKRDSGAVQAIGGDPRRVRKLAERDAFRQVLGFGRGL